MAEGNSQILRLRSCLGRLPAHKMQKMKEMKTSMRGSRKPNSLFSPLAQVMNFAFLDPRLDLLLYGLVIFLLSSSVNSAPRAGTVTSSMPDWDASPPKDACLDDFSCRSVLTESRFSIDRGSPFLTSKPNEEVGRSEERFPAGGCSENGVPYDEVEEYSRFMPPRERRGRSCETCRWYSGLRSPAVSGVPDKGRVLLKSSYTFHSAWRVSATHVCTKRVPVAHLLRHRHPHRHLAPRHCSLRCS